MSYLTQMRAMMKSLWKINLVIMVSSIAGLSSCKLKAPKQESKVNVLGGQVATAGKFPHVVQLLLSPTVPEICSGVIIGPRTVIAAAHCIKNDANDLYNNPFVLYEDQNQQMHTIGASKVYAFSKVFNAKVIYENEVGIDFVILDFDQREENSKGPFSHLPFFPKLRAADEGLNVTIVGFGATELGKSEKKTKKSFGYNTIHKVDRTVGSIKISGSEKVDLNHALATKGDSGGPLLNKDGTDIIGLSSALKTDPVTNTITNYFVDLNSDPAQILLGYYKLTLEKSGYEVAENELLVGIANKKLDDVLTLEDKITANGLWPYSTAPEKLEPTCLLLKLLFLKFLLGNNNGKGNVVPGTNGLTPQGATAESQASIQVTKNWPFGGSVNLTNSPKASLALVQQENRSPIPASGSYSYFEKSRQPAGEIQFNKFLGSKSRHVSIPLASVDLTSNFMQPSAP